MAAAQLLSVESATGDDVSVYQLKWVEWGGDVSPVVVQVIYNSSLYGKALCIDANSVG